MSATDLRIINSAIFAESEHNDLDELTLPISKLGAGDCILDNELASFSARNLNTYRCITTSKSDFSVSKTELRCKVVNNLKNGLTREKETNFPKKKESKTFVTQISKSTPNVTLNGKLSFEDWKQKKEEELLKKKKREEEESKKVEKKVENEEEEKQKRQENFVKWMRQKYLTKKKENDNQQQLQNKMNELSELNQILEEVNRVEWIKWHVKKKMKQKAELQKLMDEKKKKKEKEAEQQKKLAENLKAFEEWVAKSKFMPKPTTQCLLPHKNAKPTYINPKPWQSVIDPTTE